MCILFQEEQSKTNRCIMFIGDDHGSVASHKEKGKSSSQPKSKSSSTCGDKDGSRKKEEG